VTVVAPGVLGNFLQQHKSASAWGKENGNNNNNSNKKRRGIELDRLLFSSLTSNDASRRHRNGADNLHVSNDPEKKEKCTVPFSSKGNCRPQQKPE